MRVHTRICARIKVFDPCPTILVPLLRKIGGDWYEDLQEGREMKYTVEEIQFALRAIQEGMDD